MTETAYISAKVPHHIKHALDAIVTQRRMQDGADVRRSELIREALLDYIDAQAKGSDKIRRAIEEATS